MCNPSTENLIEWDCRHHNVEYGADRLTNHTIPALVALDNLGLGNEAVAAWHSRYSQRLESKTVEKAPPSNLDAKADVASQLGAARHGSMEEVAAWCEGLLRGGRQHELVEALHNAMGVEAFHGLILAGWALRCERPSIRGYGFAYWACSCRELRSVDRCSGQFAPHQLLECVATMARHARLTELARLTDPSFQDRFAKVERAFPEEQFDVQLEAAQVADLDSLFGQLKEDFAKLFCLAGSRDFFLLHTITATEAMHRVAQLVHDRTELVVRCVRGLWRHALVTVVAQGLPTLAEQLPPLEEETPETLALAVDYDEHLAKLAMMAREARRGSLLQNAYVSSVNAIVVSKKGFLFNPPLASNL